MESKQGQEQTLSEGNPSPEGLRYRKKLKARLAVERAALELVIERGYDGVTVEDICARAEISKKTFFNYFPSKAAVIMGRLDAFPDDERLVEILEEHDEVCYLDVLVGVVGTTITAGVDEKIESLRREALRSMPQLFFHGQRDLLAVQRSIAAALGSYLDEHPERRMLAGASVEEEALVASSTAIGLARTRSMLHVCGEAAPTAAETRRLIMAYLSAGDDRPS
ncbi:TetR/AcrR family transcriptional regulator [Gordonibacter sp. 28C]|uniref:TetR/AcrR family transcriptional regulator n=1 Tax=Gordonibacter sp. 28C TaxID=2078569 RepID=UPI001F540875|nr:TetR/AcrR family transcriptional regulator [Gordonibacter sp. 28C]